MAPQPGHLAEHPLPPGITGALNINGYLLLVEVGGVGTGRLGKQIFLLVAPDPDPNTPNPGTQIALHHPNLNNEQEVPAWTALAAQLGYLRLSGYRLVLERDGLRSAVQVIDPSTGGVVAKIPPKRKAGMLSPAVNVSQLVADLKGLPAAGPPIDPQRPDLMREVLLALALRDEETSGEQAVDLADRALELTRADASLAPQAALNAARGG
jgi:hypothetical protein